MNKTAIDTKTDIHSAFTLFQQGRLTDALEICNWLILNNISKVDALNLAGIIEDKLNNKESAVSFFQKAVKLNPKNPQILTNLASTLIELKQYKKAKNYLLTATQGNSNYSDAFYNLGNIYLLEEQNQLAKKYFKKAIGLNSNHFRALNNLATIYKKIDDIECAITAYESAIKINPNFAEALEGLAGIYFEKENYELAEKFLLDALKHDPQLANANILLGKLYFEQHEDKDKALPYLNIAQDFFPLDINIYNMLGSIYYKKGDLENAKSVFLKSIEHNSEQILTLNYLGQIFQELRDYKKAEGYFEKALLLEPDNSKIMNNYGHFLREKGDLDKSVEYHEKSINIDKELPAKDRALAINNLSHTQLIKQDFLMGWKSYRYRPSIMESKLELCPDKKTISLQGKRILWLRDQGIGDELFFLRFAHLLTKYDATNYYQASNKLYPIIKNYTGFNSIFSSDYNENEFDYIFSIGDLPYLLGHSSKETIPEPFALQSDTVLIDPIRKLLHEFGPPPYIGISWKAGRMLDNKRIGAYHKFIDLSELCAVLRPLNGTIISLQVNPKREDLEQLSVDLQRPILDVSPYHNQLDSMLCVLDLLDYYIAVSNTYVHMREGLKKASHVFVNSPPEWRWLSEGEKSFWMPNSLVFRQSRNGSWEDAIKQCQKHIKCTL